MCGTLVDAGNTMAGEIDVVHGFGGVGRGRNRSKLHIVINAIGQQNGMLRQRKSGVVVIEVCIFREAGGGLIACH